MRTEGSGRTAAFAAAGRPFCRLGRPRARGISMDLLTAVAISMLSVSRLRAALVFSALRHSQPDVGPGLLLDALKVPAAEAHELAAAAVAAASEALEAAPALGMIPVPWFDSRYPALLACTTDMPPVLWTAGNLQALEAPAVAIVGSRAATPYALQVGRRLAG